MSIADAGVGFAISKSMSFKKITSIVLDIIKSSGFSFVLDEDPRNHLHMLKDPFYLYLNRASNKLEPVRVNVSIDTGHKVDPELESFYDRSISTYNIATIGTEFYRTYAYSKKRDGSDPEYADRIIEIAKILSKELKIIQAISLDLQLEFFEGILWNKWENDPEILEACNRDLVFFHGIWYAIVNLRHYGGEKTFLQTMDKTNRIWNRFYREDLERDEVKNKYQRKHGNLDKWQETYDLGIPLPRIDKLSDDRIFIKTVDDYQGTASEIDRDPNVLKLFKKLASEYKEE